MGAKRRRKREVTRRVRERAQANDRRRQTKAREESGGTYADHFLLLLLARDQAGAL